uniref:Uncharacterized protein n=1 Tax=viral metagenome TaxID=1070528 RepID=A0A6C0CJQ6_9ZZZZ
MKLRSGKIINSQTEYPEGLTLYLDPEGNDELFKVISTRHRNIKICIISDRCGMPVNTIMTGSVSPTNVMTVTKDFFEMILFKLINTNGRGPSYACIVKVFGCSLHDFDYRNIYRLIE